jgi:PEP-CTERM motif
MHLKGTLVMSLPALFLTLCAVSATPTAHADTIAWATWNSATAGNPGSASGTLAGGITVTYSGQTSGLTTVPSWTPATTFSGGDVSNNPPDAASVQLEGGTPAGAPPITETITFSSAIVDPVFAVWSLGASGTPASFDFITKDDLTLESGGPSAEFGGSTITLAGSVINGVEGNGVVRIDGDITSISFTTPTFEDYYAFTVGYDATLTGPTPTVPEPATLSLFGLGLAALAFARRSIARHRS